MHVILGEWVCGGRALLALGLFLCWHPQPRHVCGTGQGAAGVWHRVALGTALTTVLACVAPVCDCLMLGCPSGCAMCGTR